MTPHTSEISPVSPVINSVEVKMESPEKLPVPELPEVSGVARTRRLLLGIGLTVMSGFCFSLTAVVVKYVKNVSPGTMAAFRYLGILVLSFPLALESKQPLIGSLMANLWIVLRSLAGGTSVFCRYAALGYMSMADSTIIILSMPVFVFVFARIFLKEHFGRYHVLALLMSIVGIIFASKVDFLFPHHNSLGSNKTISTNWTSTTTTTMASNVTDGDYNDYDDQDTGGFFTSDKMIGTAFSLGATLVGCFVYIIIRKLKEVNKSVILFKFSVIALLEMVAIDFAFFDFHLPLDGWSPYLITLLGLLSFYAQLLLTRAIQIEEAGVVSVVRTSSEAFFVFIFQIIFFHEVPDAFSITGAILVLSSVVLLSFNKFLRGLPDGHRLKKKFWFLAK